MYYLLILLPFLSSPPQLLSSTSCLCKDPATAVVNIIYVQTPWCRDIHSLFPVPSEEAHGAKDYEMSFSKTFCFVLNFFFLLCPTGAFFSLLLLLLPIYSVFGSHPIIIFTQILLFDWGFFFPFLINHCFLEQQWRGRSDSDDPLLSLYCLAGSLSAREVTDLAQDWPSKWNHCSSNHPPSLNLLYPLPFHNKISTNTHNC